MDKIKTISAVVKSFSLRLLTRLNPEPIKKMGSLIYIHRILLIIIFLTIAFVVFMAGAVYTGYFMPDKQAAQKDTTNDIFNSKAFENATPEANPTAINTPVPTDSANPDTSTDTGSESTVYNNPLPTLTLIPTVAPLNTPVPTTAPASTAPTTGSSSGNSNCSTASGIPNAWYSDVYPNPPVTTGTGSVTLIVTIRDCNKNTAPVSDNLTVTLSSGDSNTQINGNSLPATVTTQNGQASFSVASQVSGKVTLVVQDTSRSFTVTDINNNNPVITFTAISSESSAPTPTQAPDATSTPAPTSAPDQTPTPAPSSAPTPTGITPSATITGTP